MSTASNRAPWNVNIDSGYFYIEDREYFLYSDKQVYETVPVSGKITLPAIADFQMMNAPIIITNTIVTATETYTAAAAASIPFGKTWEPPVGDWTPTPHKYEPIVDLTGLTSTFISASGTEENYSFNLQNNQFAISFGSPGVSGHYTPTITLNQGIDPVPLVGDAVIVEWEGHASTGYHTPTHLDLNPLHSSNLLGKFIVVRDVFPSGSLVFAVNDHQYSMTGGIHVPVSATVYDENGSPIPNVWVNWKIKAEVADGGSIRTRQLTDWSGTSRVTYVPPTPITPGTENAVQLAKGIHVIASIADEVGRPMASGVIRMEPGIIYG